MGESRDSQKAIKLESSQNVCHRHSIISMHGGRFRLSENITKQEHGKNFEGPQL